ncbi:MAG: hypothetical protein EA366_03190 [Spirulina sp. DLM2.Bin59]|nr:MAG: hypothetical protein EA366_03190 [Spirulina sp. DLM2.Bin59]
MFFNPCYEFIAVVSIMRMFQKSETLFWWALPTSPHPKPLSQRGRGALDCTSSIEKLLYIIAL